MTTEKNAFEVPVFCEYSQDRCQGSEEFFTHCFHFVMRRMCTTVPGFVQHPVDKKPAGSSLQDLLAHMRVSISVVQDFGGEQLVVGPQASMESSSGQENYNKYYNTYK